MMNSFTRIPNLSIFTKYFVLALTLFAFMPSQDLQAQARIDCSKICYEYGTVSTGGSICIGAPGAVPPNCTVVIRDSRGNTQTTRSRADGSFGTTTTNLIAPVGRRVTVIVNGQRCNVIVKRPGACQPPNGGNNNGGNNNGGFGNDIPGNDNPDNPDNPGNTGGTAGEPCDPAAMSAANELIGKIAQLKSEALGLLCQGDKRGASQLLGQAQQLEQQLNQLIRGLFQNSSEPNPNTGGVLTEVGGNGVAIGNGNGGGLVAAAGKVDCAKIGYSRGTVATGGPICAGRKGAVPGNSTVEIIDKHGNVTTTKSNVDGSFRTTCPNHVVRPGDRITIRVNGKSCVVTARR